jgi:hypothetical protein
MMDASIRRTPRIDARGSTMEYSISLRSLANCLKHQVTCIICGFLGLDGRAGLVDPYLVGQAGASGRPCGNRSGRAA